MRAHVLRCLFCRCTPTRSCPGGCGWLPNTTVPICTQCAAVGRAYAAHLLEYSMLPAPDRVAFARGYFRAVEDRRNRDSINPYVGGTSAQSWVRGFNAGTAGIKLQIAAAPRRTKRPAIADQTLTDAELVDIVRALDALPPALYRKARAILVAATGKEAHR